METKCPTLWKPKKKLCYLPSTEGPTEKGDGTLTLLDVDRMFDDLDSPSHDLLPSPPVCDTFDVETNRRETSFSKAHMPMRTSSPIENNTPVKELDIAKDQAVSPILFACDDDRAEEARRAPPPHQKPQCNGDATEESEDFVFGCPPSKVVIPKPKKSIQKNKVEGACKESQTIQINPPQEPQTPVVEVKRKTPRKEIVAPPAAAESRESELASPEKTIENVAKQPPGKSIRSERELEAFLKRLRDTAQSKPACLRKSPVKSPCPPSEPEDEFLILEDEVPIWISIPTKSASNKKRLKKEPSNESEKEEEQRKTSKETREEEAAGKIDKKALNSKTSKTLKDAKTSRAKPLKRDKKVLQGSNGEADEATRKKGPSSEEVEAADLGSLSDEKIMPPETQTEEDSADAKTDENNKPPVVSKGSSSDDSLVLGKRKSRQPGEWWMEHRSPERTAVKSNQPTVKRAKQKNKQPSAAAVASPVRAETDKDTDYQPTIKKYKKPDQEPCGAAASPAKGKKDKVVKKRNQTRPAPSSSHKTNKAKEKKQNKKTGGQTWGEEMHTAEADHSEEQQEEGEDQQSSPLVFSHRDLSNNSGDKLFQKIFQPVSSEKKASTTPAPASPRGKEPLSAGRRSRRCPGSWWMVNDKCENVESVSSRPQQQEVKPQKERKKRIRTPPTPKNGNTAALSETPARSAAPLLEPKALSSQKKVKASLAAFKDIFSSPPRPRLWAEFRRRDRKPRSVLWRKSPLLSVPCSVVLMKLWRLLNPYTIAPPSLRCQGRIQRTSVIS
ncbi:uncharacterized protein si:ch211-161h7.4 isoform X1 [Eleginops maclovinus]|uniref:uncharacterized protein si:ch211-161h7.4 isoform X1 n=2 Tax=Eleginops maclovinus TaxID=56733 RepID=UPI003080ECC2